MATVRAEFTYKNRDIVYTIDGRNVTEKMYTKFIEDNSSNPTMEFSVGKGKYAKIATKADFDARLRKMKIKRFFRMKE